MSTRGFEHEKPLSAENFVKAMEWAGSLSTLEQLLKAASKHGDHITANTDVLKETFNRANEAWNYFIGNNTDKKNLITGSPLLEEYAKKFKELRTIYNQVLKLPPTDLGQVAAGISGDEKNAINSETEQKFLEWKSSFNKKILELKNSFPSNISKFSPSLLLRLRKELNLLVDEYYTSVNETFPSVQNNVSFEAIFRTIEETLVYYENISVFFILEEEVETTKKLQGQDDTNIEGILQTLSDLVNDATQKISFVKQEHKAHVRGILENANKIISQAKKDAQEEETKNFTEWKKNLDNTFNPILETIDTVIGAPDKKMSDISDLLSIIDTLKNTFLKTYEQSNDKKRNYINELIQKLEARVVKLKEQAKELTDKDLFEKEEQAVTDYKAAIQPLETELHEVINGTFVANYLPEVRVKTAKIVRLYTDAVNRKLNIRSQTMGERVNTIRIRIFGGDSNGGEYSQALQLLKERETQIQQEKQDFDNYLGIMQTNYMAPTNSPTESDVTKAKKRMEAIIEHQPESFKKFFGLYCRLRDGYYQSTFKNTGQTLMYTYSSQEARNNVKKYINTSELVQIRNLRDVSYVDPEGRQHTINIKMIVDRVEQYFTDISWENGKFNYARNGDINKWYASISPQGEPLDSNGRIIRPENCEFDDSGELLLTMVDRLSQDFPEINEMSEFVRESLHIFIVLAEMRKNFIIKEFASYKASPIPNVQDFGDLPIIAPKAQDLYNIQSSTFLDQSLFPYLFMMPQSPQPGWIPVTVDMPKSAVGFNIEMPDQVTFYIPKSCANVSNIVTATKLTEIIRSYVSTTEIGKLELHHHLKVLPSYYDIISGSFDGIRLKRQPTLEEYNDIMTKVSSFYESITTKFVPLQHYDDLDTHVGDMISNIKNFKGIFAVIDTDRDELFTPLVQLLMIVGLKKLFASYKELIQKEIREKGVKYLDIKHLPDKTHSILFRFIDIVEPLLISSKTLPQHLLTAPDTTLVEREFDIVGKIFNSIKQGPKLLNNPLGNIAKKVTRGAEYAFTYWGAFFDNDLEPGKIESDIKTLLNHELYKELELYSRRKEISVEDNKK